MKIGQTQFSHPPGTHPDRLWAFALAVYAARYETLEHRFLANNGRNRNSLMPNLPRLPSDHISKGSSKEAIRKSKSDS
jgi:hypothetical protein